MTLLTAALLASAAALAGSACVVRAQARRAERDHPPRGRFLEVDGARLHYVDRGQGTPVVLLHGNGAMIEDWEISGVLDLAARRHRVIAWDRPGFGYSARPRDRIWTAAAQAELMRQGLRALGIARYVVVGHSWGTLVALAMALAHPEEVAGLVLLSGYYFPTPRADVPLLSSPAVPVVGDLMRHTVSPLLGRALAPKIIAKMFAPAPVPPRFTADFPIGLALRPSQIRATSAESALMIPGAATLSRRYHELIMPVALMAGAGDEIVDPVRHSKHLHDEIPGSTLRLIEGGGHMIHHLSPQAVVDLIEQVESPRSDIGSSRGRAAG